MLRTVGEIHGASDLSPDLTAIVEAAWNRLTTALERLAETKVSTTPESLHGLLQSLQTSLDPEVLKRHLQGGRPSNNSEFRCIMATARIQ